MLLTHLLFCLLQLSNIVCLIKLFHEQGVLLHVRKLFPILNRSTMVVIACPINGCEYATEDLQEESLLAKLIELHMLSHTSQSSAKAPKLARPTIDVGANEERWNAFKRRWETFRRGSRIEGAEASAQLFECAGTELSELVLSLDQEITCRPIDQVMSTMHSLAVVPVAKAVIRAELINLHQGTNEPFRTFVARVKGKAKTCGYQSEVDCKKCGETLNADYTTAAMKDILLAGISDIDIRREALSVEGILHKPINELISFIERREMSRAAAPGTVVSAISTFKRGKSGNVGISQTSDSRKKTRPCPSCNEMYNLYRKGRNGWNRRPFEQCFNCWRKSTSAQNCVMLTKVKPKVSKFVFSHATFKRQCLNFHPIVQLQIRHMKNNKSAHIIAVADTGAQSNLWSFDDFINKGFSKDDLRPVTLRISAANNNFLNIIGGFEAKFQGISPDGKCISCSAVIYVSDSVSCFYLSYTTMKDLGIIDQKFPTIGNCADGELNNKPCCSNALRDRDEIPVFDDYQQAFVRALNSGCVSNRNCENASVCDCPVRERVPSRPNTLPFAAIPENNAKMRDWLLQKFASSTFNTCPHRPLQQMAGPDMEIHIDKFAKPRVYNTPVPIPLHWQDQVYKDLSRDEALTVIERVPCRVPLSWCHRMVITRKHDGSPRRAVDLSPLNKYCKREVYSSQSV